MSSEQHQHRENLAWHFPLSRLADKDIGVDAAEQAQQGLQNKFPPTSLAFSKSNSKKGHGGALRLQQDSSRVHTAF